MEARHLSLSRLANAAREHGAKHILLAGDTFDTSTPSASIIQQSLSAMSDVSQAHWWLLPGNHDNMKDAEPLWETIVRDAPQNVHVLTDNTPIELNPGVQLLPCPVAYRSTGRDPTSDLSAVATADGELRIGLAHAGVVDFAGIGGAIPPDRDRTAGLDYLALGDWHGRLKISARTHYSGSPEQDRFKHDRRGVCLAVTIDAPGAAPQVEEVETGEFLWAKADVQLVADADPVSSIKTILPIDDCRNVLMRVKLNGWASLSGQADLRQIAEEMNPHFGFLDIDISALSTIYDEADLDEIDQAGALRLAANRLKENAESESSSAEERDVSAKALSRLHAYVREAGS